MNSNSENISRKIFCTGCALVTYDSNKFLLKKSGCPKCDKKILICKICGSRGKYVERQRKFDEL